MKKLPWMETNYFFQRITLFKQILPYIQHETDFKYILWGLGHTVQKVESRWIVLLSTSERTVNFCFQPSFQTKRSMQYNHFRLRKPILIHTPRKIQEHVISIPHVKHAAIHPLKLRVLWLVMSFFVSSTHRRILLAQTNPEPQDQNAIHLWEKAHFLSCSFGVVKKWVRILTHDMGFSLNNATALENSFNYYETQNMLSQRFISSFSHYFLSNIYVLCTCWCPDFPPHTSNTGHPSLSLSLKSYLFETQTHDLLICELRHLGEVLIHSSRPNAHRNNRMTRSSGILWNKKVYLLGLMLTSYWPKGNFYVLYHFITTPYMYLAHSSSVVYLSSLNSWTALIFNVVYHLSKSRVPMGLKIQAIHFYPETLATNTCWL